MLACDYVDSQTCMRCVRCMTFGAVDVIAQCKVWMLLSIVQMPALLLMPYKLICELRGFWPTMLVEFVAVLHGVTLCDGVTV